MYEAVVWTNAAHEYTSWHHTAEVIFGWREQDAVGRHWRDLFPNMRRQAFGRIWISFDYRVTCWHAQHLLGWRTTEVMGHRIEEYALETDQGGAGRLECETGWSGVALMATRSGSIVAVNASVGPTRGGYLLSMSRVIPEVGAGSDVAHLGRWYGAITLDAKDGTPRVLSADVKAQIANADRTNGYVELDGDEVITGYRIRLRRLLSSELFMQAAGSNGKEVKTNTPQIAAPMLHIVPHVTNRVTGPKRDPGAFSAPMTAVDVEHKLLVARNLRLVRDARGKTQHEVSKKIKAANHTVISRWESPKTGGRITWEHLEQLAKVYGIKEGAIWFHRPQTEVPPTPEGWTW